MIGCASTSVGTGFIDGKPASLEVREHIGATGINVSGYNLIVNGRDIGVLFCHASCSTLTSGSNVVDFGPLQSDLGVFTLKRIYKVNMLYIEVLLDGEYIGTVSLT